jgi:hypothetical protein
MKKSQLFIRKEFKVSEQKSPHEMNLCRTRDNFRKFLKTLFENYIYKRKYAEIKKITI